MPKKNILRWEKVLQDSPKAYKKWFDAEKKFFLKHIKLGSRVLEVGCGDGRSLRDVSEITDKLTGVDHDIAAVEHAKEKLKDIPNCNIILAEGKNLPFADKEFDCVTCIGTFANLGEDKYKVLEEMRRVLKDNGMIIISSYSEKALEERMKVYQDINAEILEVRDNGTIVFEDIEGDYVSEQFSEEELGMIFEKVGLKMAEIEDAGIGYICKLTKKFNI